MYSFIQWKKLRFQFFSLLFSFQFFFGAGWLVAIGTGLSVVYGPHANDKKATEAVNVIYCMLFRTVWAIAVGWVIYASHNGYGGKDYFELVTQLQKCVSFVSKVYTTEVIAIVISVCLHLFH